MCREPTRGGNKNMVLACVGLGCTLDVSQFMVVSVIPCNLLVQVIFVSFATEHGFPFSKNVAGDS